MDKITGILKNGDEWRLLLNLLPKTWEEDAKTSGALVRKRRIGSASDLLRLILTRVCGESGRAASALFTLSGTAEMSDVAVMKRLAGSAEWLKNLCSGMLLKTTGMSAEDFGKPSLNYKIKCVDASTLRKAGPDGGEWLLHYSMGAGDLGTADFSLTRKKEKGESMTNFKITAGDLYLGDRAYGTLTGMERVVRGEAAFVFRLRTGAFAYYSDEGPKTKTDPGSELEKLDYGEVADLPVYAGKNPAGAMRIRLCAIRKSRAEAAKSLKKLRATGRRKGVTYSVAAERMSGFILCATNLEPTEATATEVMELYRYRWQVETAFKRMKSLMDAGKIPNQREDSTPAWIYGKLLTALLIEAVLKEGRLFSPWGYRMR